MNKILVVDNYDSFTYNLVQYIQEILGRPVDVFRNDAISLDEVAKYDVIVLSPGPGIPSEAGIMPALIRRYASEKTILGVCLGHQAIGEAFGGELLNLDEVYHGIETPMVITNPSDPIYKDIPSPFQAGRYHSWVVKKENCPEVLQINSVDEKGVVMGFKHQAYNVWGVQYHPESIMTDQGKAILRNFFDHCVPKPEIN